ncbi:MAG: peptide-methionine (S)-S-oxide reductase MsrA [Candidatus Aenigmarchaeota archaeon]|nr:peptide-methionine (S)-S-oxide reductase MsrA [Candidatus Aenigmarchaeota archaeon]
MPTQTATFAAGCFWGVEAAFRKAKGVIEVTSGYAGGFVQKPAYEQVCTGRTGHAEAVQIEFDPQKVSYEELLLVFWDMHEPTQLNRQGPDIGTQYRSAVFYHSEAQRKAAEKSKEEVQKKHRGKIVTEIVPAKEFWRAEEYHQRYLEKHNAVC